MRTETRHDMKDLHFLVIRYRLHRLRTLECQLFGKATTDIFRPPVALSSAGRPMLVERRFNFTCSIIVSDDVSFLPNPTKTIMTSCLTCAELRLFQNGYSLFQHDSWDRQGFLLSGTKSHHRCRSVVLTIAGTPSCKTFSVCSCSPPSDRLSVISILIRLEGTYTISAW